VLNIHESYVMVEGVTSPSNLVVFLISTHIEIDMRLTGVEVPVRDFAAAGKEWIVRNALHRRAVVRISSWDAEERCFIGPFVQRKADEAVQQMVREGLLTFCEQTAEWSASADLSVEPGLLKLWQRNYWRTKATRPHILCMDPISILARASTLTRCKPVNISNSQGTEAIQTAK
jgi:hypothetical protein